MKKLLISLLILTLTMSAIGNISVSASKPTDEVLIAKLASNALHEKIISKKNLNKAIKLKKKYGSKGIYLDESKSEYYLQVTNDKFHKVGKLDLDMNNEVDKNKLLNCNISKGAKDEIFKSVNYCKENSLPIGSISVYSPMLIDNKNNLDINVAVDSTQALASSSTYFYYQGYGGYTYKQESIFYTNWHTGQASKQLDSKIAVTDFANKQAKFWADYIVGSIPTYGTIYTMATYFGNLLSDPTITQWDGSMAYTQITENSRETRLCYIRQDMGYGLQDYLRAKSCYTDMTWRERLQPQGYTWVDFKVVKNEIYTGSYFNTLDQKAYEYRTSTNPYDERMSTIRCNRTGYLFIMSN